MPLSGSGSLCTSCGLCCDGTLFTLFALEPDEDAVPLEAAGARFIQSGDFREGSQPCAALGCGGCTVYAHRPRTCRGFRCLLLKQLESGKVDLETASGIVATAKRLRAEALEQFAKVRILPAGLSMEEYANFVGVDRLVTPQARRENLAMLVACTLFQFYIARHFWVRKPDAPSGSVDGNLEHATTAVTMAAPEQRVTLQLFKPRT